MVYLAKAPLDSADDDYPDDDGVLEAENAWLRAAEYDQESQDQMYRDDMICFY